MSRKYRQFDEILDEFLQDPQYAADYLSEALHYDDVDTFLMALRDVLRVHGTLSAIAEKADISRSTLYNLLSVASNPGIRTLLSVLNAVGYDISITKRSTYRQAHRKHA